MVDVTLVGGGVGACSRPTSNEGAILGKTVFDVESIQLRCLFKIQILLYIREICSRIDDNLEVIGRKESLLTNLPI